MKKANKKLQLQALTIHILDASALSEVAGGLTYTCVAPESNRANCSNSCNSCEWSICNSRCQC